MAKNDSLERVPQELSKTWCYCTLGKDYAELEDGTWRIIEAGDGEVSGLSKGQDYEYYFRALHQCFK